MATTGESTRAAVRRLVDREVISEEQAAAVLAEIAAEPASRPGRWWVEAAGYLGGGLLLAGAAALIGVSWAALDTAGRTTVLALVAVLLAGAGVAVGGGRRVHAGTASVRRRVAGVLLALASGPAAFAAAVATDGRPPALGPAVGLAVAAAGYAWLHSVPGLLVTAALSFLTVATATSDMTTNPLVMAFALLALAAVWAALAVGGAVGPRALGLGVAAAVGLIGGQQPLGTPDLAPWAYVLTLAVAVACLVGYRWLQAPVLLVAGVIGVTVAVSEAVWDATNGAGGAAVILLVAGAVLLAASAAGLRLNRRGHADAAAPKR
jgi:hypothetical protein